MKKLLFIAFCGAMSSFGFSQLVNGDFETGDFTGWSTQAAGSGSLFGVSGGGGQSGAFYAYFGAVSSQPDYIFQNATVTNGSSYVLSVWLNNSGQNGDDNMEILWEGTSLFNGSAPVGWTNFSYNVTATSNASEVRIGGFDGPDFSFADNVTLTPVPEPATFAVFGLGIAAAAFLRRRR